MASNLKRRIAALGTAALLASSPMLVSAPADAAALICRASVSDSTPKQYSNVYVRVRTGASGAAVRTVARYKTTDTAKSTRANSRGLAQVKYYISGATGGFRVRVDVTVRKNGRTRTCSTSFTPHR